MLKFCCDLRSNSPALNNVIEQAAYAFLTVKHGNFANFTDLHTFFNADNFDKHAKDFL